MSQPLLVHWSAASQQNSHLAILHGADVLYLIEQRFPGRPSLVSDVGVRLPATLTASGLAILSAMPAAQVRAVFGSAEDFVQRHGLGPTSLSTLRALLTATRHRGYAVEVDSITPGLASIAVAVEDHVGYPIAAVTVTFAAETNGGISESLVSAVRHCAYAVSRRLGHS